MAGMSPCAESWTCGDVLSFRGQRNNVLFCFRDKIASVVGLFSVWRFAYERRCQGLDMLKGQELVGPIAVLDEMIRRSGSAIVRRKTLYGEIRCPKASCQKTILPETVHPETVQFASMHTGNSVPLDRTPPSKLGVPSTVQRLRIQDDRKNDNGIVLGCRLDDDLCWEHSVRPGWQRQDQGPPCPVALVRRLAQ